MKFINQKKKKKNLINSWIRWRKLDDYWYFQNTILTCMILQTNKILPFIIKICVCSIYFCIRSFIFISLKLELEVWSIVSTIFRWLLIITYLKKRKILWGQKVLEVLAHSISSPRPTPRRKKCPGTNEGNPNCQNVLPRATLSSAGQNHGRKKRHIARGHPLEDHKRDSKPYGLAIGE